MNNNENERMRIFRAVNDLNTLPINNLITVNPQQKMKAHIMIAVFN